MDTEQFSSLGDNCEFGFVQRFLGVEPGGLLRWAITPPDALVKALDADLAGLYEYDNLTPAGSDMVWDTRFGLAFHTGMLSRDGAFTADEESRRKIFATEKEKVNYLSGKLLAEVTAGKKTFVYKCNAGISAEQLGAIGSAIARKGPGKLLHVTDRPGLEGDSELPMGKVRHLQGNIYIARIDRFAPYDKANEVSMDVWTAILQDALDKMVP